MLFHNLKGSSSPHSDHATSLRNLELSSPITMNKQPVDEQPMDAWAEALQGAHGWPGRITKGDWILRFSLLEGHWADRSDLKQAIVGQKDGSGGEELKDTIRGLSYSLAHPDFRTAWDYMLECASGEPQEVALKRGTALFRRKEHKERRYSIAFTRTVNGPEASSTPVELIIRVINLGDDIDVQQNSSTMSVASSSKGTTEGSTNTDSESRDWEKEPYSSFAPSAQLTNNSARRQIEVRRGEFVELEPKGAYDFGDSANLPSDDDSAGGH